ncbi:PREDICTED: uncharacterized protein LOC105453872 [Wasmannia auropunctata]|uniref:uncharacterized protein LOC105453872 n=1 Tax=Wasmannia auropunctata TaxID=64793 RepID=UPI0005EEFE69|nr:PREDICTED: uncharacterized protein LOC105453872 [Wasmannia auropunctata]
MDFRPCTYLAVCEVSVDYPMFIPRRSCASNSCEVGADSRCNLAAAHRTYRGISGQGGIGKKNETQGNIRRWRSHKILCECATAEYERIRRETWETSDDDGTTQRKCRLLFTSHKDCNATTNRHACSITINASRSNK